ncbi:hypothetical protein SLEP1_g35589 [Rubroshorea leprosula]|uniref:Uncharacterized protein n=1 Tax=Rubroshorea leprosula TaxID=152421 RepID=A0AAV5KNN1_9ROSI|nr:hypothetical protein SLEP1_g35589 [Rubroshorea leprosula]
MASKLNLKGRLDFQKDPSTSCSAARLNDGKEVNVAGEACLHDCKKSNGAQQAVMNWVSELVLPGHRNEKHSVFTAVRPQSKEEETDVRASSYRNQKTCPSLRLQPQGNLLLVLQYLYTTRHQFQ